MLKQKEWIDIIVAKTGCTKKEAKVFYDCIFDYIREQISSEEAIKISGFGVLKLRKTAAKEQINLLTQQPEIVPEHYVITFRPYFEIDPKPTPIDVEVDEDVVEMTMVSDATDVVTDEVVENAEEDTDEVVENAVEETTDNVTDEVVEDTPTTISEDDIVWIYEGKKCTTTNIKLVLRQKTTLKDEDILVSLDIVIEKMKNIGKTTCEVKEENNFFDFIIIK